MTVNQPVPIPTSPVTLLDIYTRQVEMGSQLAVMTERINALPDHEARIRALEAAKAKLYGACLAISALAGGGAGWIALALTHH